MRARSLSVARVLSSHVPVSWQEAVAVVHAADELSAATGMRYTPEGCQLTTAGDVYLSPPSSSNTSGAMSSLQLLAALLGKDASAQDLRRLVVAVDTTSAEEGDGRLRVDLQWCLSADPKADIARLAARALAAGPDQGHGSADQETDGSAPPEPPAKPRPPIASSDMTIGRRHAITVRVPRLSLGWVVGMGALLLAIGGGMAAIGAFIGQLDTGEHPATVAADAPRELPSSPR